MSANRALLQVVHQEPAYCFGPASTRVCITRTAGMMAPVTFFADSDSPIQPYHIAPWCNEGTAPDLIPLLAVLRGDFFCAPFGGNDEPFDDVQYLPHGEAANETWDCVDVRDTVDGSAIHLTQTQKLRAGRIHKRIAVVEGQSVVYSRHDLEGFDGPMCFGHHPNLYVPPEAGAGKLSFAPIRHAHTYVHPTERPEERGYSILKPDAAIEDLTRCPTIDGETTDLTRYPSRRGYEDLVMLCAAEGLRFGWTAFALPKLGYVWFSLKDPRVLVSTLLWMSNGGRHMPPWNGRHVNVIGLEEITAFFHEGLASSAKKNFINEMGVPTHRVLKPNETHSIPFIQGVARIPLEFKGVSRIEAADKEALRIVDEAEREVTVAVDWKFLERGSIKDLLE